MGSLLEIAWMRIKRRWLDLRERLVKLLSIEEPWTLILDDALANSFIAPVTDDIKEDRQLIYLSGADMQGNGRRCKHSCCDSSCLFKCIYMIIFQKKQTRNKETTRFTATHTTCAPTT